MSRKALASIAALSVLALTGCDGTDVDEEGRENKSSFSIHEIEYEPGQHVTCIYRKTGYAGGMSCDWEGARR